MEKDITIDGIPILEFRSPDKILKGFIEKLSEGVKKEKQWLKEVKAVQQIVEAVSKLIR